jgi:hypothetical protein
LTLSKKPKVRPSFPHLNEYRQAKRQREREREREREKFLSVNYLFKLGKIKFDENVSFRAHCQY